LSVSIRVTGAPEIARALENIGEKLARNTVRRGAVAAARVFAEEAKRLAPYDPGGPDLREAPKVITRTPQGVPQAWVVIDPKNPHGFLAVMHEYGVAAHWIGKEGEELKIGDNVVEGPVLHPGHRAQPFFRPAFDTQQDAALAAFAAKLKSDIETRGYDKAEPESDAA